MKDIAIVNIDGESIGCLTIEDDFAEQLFVTTNKTGNGFDLNVSISPKEIVSFYITNKPCKRR